VFALSFSSNLLQSVIQLLPRREACNRLVSKGVYVVIACRDLAAGRKVVKELQVSALHFFASWKQRHVTLMFHSYTCEFPYLQSLAPQGHSEPVAEAMQCDLASLHSVIAFADAFRTRGLKCHILLLNAGVCPSTTQTAPTLNEDGYEIAFATSDLPFFSNIALQTLGDDLALKTCRCSLAD
jgi:NAD(P)-dependent dehydrogenase (short-subunit alcohol dehydrogenase family)